MTRPVSGVHGSGLRTTFTGISNRWSLTVWMKLRGRDKHRIVQLIFFSFSTKILVHAKIKVKIISIALSQHHIKTIKWSTLTARSDLLDLPQNLSFHVGVSAELLPCCHDASLFGQFCQLFLVGNHEADHIVLFTAMINIRNKVGQKSKRGKKATRRILCGPTVNTLKPIRFFHPEPNPTPLIFSICQYPVPIPYLIFSWIKWLH